MTFDRKSRRAVQSRWSGPGMQDDLPKARRNPGDVLLGTERALTYHERLRATGAQALRCVRDAGMAKHASRGQRAKGNGNNNTHAKPLPISTPLGPVTVPPEVGTVTAPLDQQFSYVPMCGTSPTAASQVMHDRQPMSPAAGSPQGWLRASVDSLSPGGPMIKVVQFPEDHADLMAIAMPQAALCAWNQEQIAAQLRAAAPVQYED
uniref:Uncharacterized protein n=1 Tax=Alexandrium monilatum TaxID=311494 RepID=A0A7S4PY14_9DINO